VGRKKRIWETWAEYEIGSDSIKCSGCGTPTDYGQGSQAVDEHGKVHRLCWSCWKRYNAELEEECEARAARKAAGVPEPPMQKELF
jgi:LSD1 subclass zinc finger protein